MRARIKNIIGWAAIGLLVGGTTAQCLHATPTRAGEKMLSGDNTWQGGKIEIILA